MEYGGEVQSTKINKMGHNNQYVVHSVFVNDKREPFERFPRVKFISFHIHIVIIYFNIRVHCIRASPATIVVSKISDENVCLCLIEKGHLRNKKNFRLVTKNYNNNGVFWYLF